VRSLRSDITTSQDLSSGALSYTTSIARQFKLERIYFHFSAAVTETITITLDSAKGANYDTVLRKVNLSSSADFVYVPEGQANFKNGDEIKVQCTNANLTGIVYVTFKTQEVLL